MATAAGTTAFTVRGVVQLDAAQAMASVRSFIAASDQMAAAAARMADRVDAASRRVASGMRRQRDEAGSLQKAFLALSTGALANQFEHLSKALIANGTELQTYRRSLTAMFGSVKEADKVMEQLLRFAERTPFEFPELTRTASKFKALNQEIMANVDLSAKAAALFNQPLETAANAIGKVGSQSIDGLKTLRNQFGFNAEAARTFGAVVDNQNHIIVRGSHAAGKAVEAFRRFVEDRGGETIFDRAEKSLLGATSSMKDKLFEVSGILGERLTGDVVAISIKFRELLQWVKELSPETQKWAARLVAVAGAMAAIGTAAAPLLLTITQLKEIGGWFRRGGSPVAAAAGMVEEVAAATLIGGTGATVAAKRGRKKAAANIVAAAATVAQAAAPTTVSTTAGAANAAAFQAALGSSLPAASVPALSSAAAAASVSSTAAAEAALAAATAAQAAAAVTNAQNAAITGSASFMAGMGRPTRAGFNAQSRLATNLLANAQMAELGSKPFFAAAATRGIFDLASSGLAMPGMPSVERGPGGKFRKIVPPPVPPELTSMLNGILAESRTASALSLASMTPFFVPGKSGMRMAGKLGGPGASLIQELLDDAGRITGGGRGRMPNMPYMSPSLSQELLNDAAWVTKGKDGMPRYASGSLTRELLDDAGAITIGPDGVPRLPSIRQSRASHELAAFGLAGQQAALLGQRRSAKDAGFMSFAGQPMGKLEQSVTKLTTAVTKATPDPGRTMALGNAVNAAALGLTGGPLGPARVARGPFALLGRLGAGLGSAVVRGGAAVGGALTADVGGTAAISALAAAATKGLGSVVTGLRAVAAVGATAVGSFTAMAASMLPIAAGFVAIKLAVNALRLAWDVDFLGIQTGIKNVVGAIKLAGKTTMEIGSGFYTTAKDYIDRDSWIGSGMTDDERAKDDWKYTAARKRGNKVRAAAEREARAKRGLPEEDRSFEEIEKDANEIEHLYKIGRLTEEQYNKRLTMLHTEAELNKERNLNENFVWAMSEKVFEANKRITAEKIKQLDYSRQMLEAQGKLTPEKDLAIVREQRQKLLDSVRERIGRYEDGGAHQQAEDSIGGVPVPAFMRQRIQDLRKAVATRMADAEHPANPKNLTKEEREQLEGFNLRDQQLQTEIKNRAYEDQTRRRNYARASMEASHQLSPEKEIAFLRGEREAMMARIRERTGGDPTKLKNQTPQEQDQFDQLRIQAERAQTAIQDRNRETLQMVLQSVGKEYDARKISINKQAKDLVNAGNDAVRVEKWRLAMISGVLAEERQARIDSARRTQAQLAAMQGLEGASRMARLGARESRGEDVTAETVAEQRRAANEDILSTMDANRRRKEEIDNQLKHDKTLTPERRKELETERANLPRLEKAQIEKIEADVDPAMKQTLDRKENLKASNDIRNMEIQKDRLALIGEMLQKQLETRGQVTADGAKIVDNLTKQLDLEKQILAAKLEMDSKDKDALTRANLKNQNLLDTQRLQMSALDAAEAAYDKIDQAKAAEQAKFRQGGEFTMGGMYGSFEEAQAATKKASDEGSAAFFARSAADAKKKRRSNLAARMGIPFSVASGDAMGLPKFEYPGTEAGNANAAAKAAGGVRVSGAVKVDVNLTDASTGKTMHEQTHARLQEDAFNEDVPLGRR